MSNRATLTMLLVMLILSSIAWGLDPSYAIPAPADAWFRGQVGQLFEDTDDTTIPMITGCRVFPTTIKRGDPRAEISAFVMDPARLAMVYAEVGARLVLMMDLDGDHRYSGYCGSNLLPGHYNISIVAVDRAGNAARAGGIAISVLDPSDLNGNRIEDCLEKLGSEEMRVIVLHEGNLSSRDKLIGREREQFRILPGSSMIIPGNRIEEISKLSGVKGVYKDQKLKILASTGPVKRPEDPRRKDYGLTGEGVTVVLLDTGADPGHSALDDMDDDPSTEDPKIVGFKDFVNGLKDPYDDNGHGTHCASLISGTSGIGVAPGTRLVVVKVMDRDGACYLSDAISALDWCLDNRNRYGIDLVSFSVGGEAPSDGNSLLDQACERMVNEGLVVCVAAGNSGPSAQSIVIPGNAGKVITVGAIDSSGKAFDQSSRGPTPDGRIKPDLVTLGVDVVSALAGSRDAQSSMSGTSMAVPQVSGAAALLLQSHPGLSPADVKRILLKSADDLGASGPDNVFGYGAMNLSRALYEIENSPFELSGPTIDKVSLSRTSGKVGDPVIIEATPKGDVEGLGAHIVGPDKEIEIPMMDFDSNGIYTAWWETSFWTPGDYDVEVELSGRFGEVVSTTQSFRLEP